MFVFIQMSLIPHLHHHLFDQDFGLGLLHDDLLHTPRRSVVGPLHLGYYHPWRYQHAQRSTNKNKDDDDCFKVRLHMICWCALCSIQGKKHQRLISELTYY
jgi:hypothetical protein